MAQAKEQTENRATVATLIKKGVEIDDLFTKPPLLARALVDQKLSISKAELITGVDGEYVSIEVQTEDKTEGKVNFGRPNEANLKLVAFFAMPKNKDVEITDVTIKASGRTYYLAQVPKKR